MTTKFWNCSQKCEHAIEEKRYVIPGGCYYEEDFCSFLSHFSLTEEEIEKVTIINKSKIDLFRAKNAAYLGINLADKIFLGSWGRQEFCGKCGKFKPFELV